MIASGFGTRVKT